MTALHKVIGIKVGGYGLVIIIASISISWAHGAAISSHVVIPWRHWWWWSFIRRRWPGRGSIHAIAIMRLLLWRRIRAIGVVWTRLTVAIVAGTGPGSIGRRCRAIIGTGRRRPRLILRTIGSGSGWWPGRIAGTLLRGPARRPHRGRSVPLWGTIAVAIPIAQTKDGSRWAMRSGSYAIILRRIHWPIVRAISVVHLGSIGSISPRNVDLLVGRRIVVLVESRVLVQRIQVVGEVQAIANAG